MVALFVLPWKLSANPIAVNYSIGGVGAVKGGSLGIRSWATYCVGGVEGFGALLQRDARPVSTTTLMGEAAHIQSSHWWPRAALISLTIRDD